MVSRVVNLEHFFPGKSEMAGRMRAFDWSASAFGPPRRWPEPLRNSVKLCLTSRFPIVMYWGRERLMLYNDAYVPFLGETKHPAYLARGGRETCSDIWDTIDPLFQAVEQTGEATWSEDFLFFFERNLPREEVYVTYTIGPILLKSGAVGGFFCPCAEVTEKVVGARRLETLRKLGIKPLKRYTPAKACEVAATVLSENPFDVPFAAIYLVDEDGDRAVLKSIAGFSGIVHPFPSVVSQGNEALSPWPLTQVLREQHTVETEDLVAAGLQLPGGPWPESAAKAIVLPVSAGQHEHLCALAVLGVSPRRVLDDPYRTFFDLVAGHIGKAISDARAYEAERRLRFAAEHAERQLAGKNEELLAAKAMTESVLASVTDTHMLLDRQWRYTYVNEAAARAIGLPREQVVGRTLWELFPDIIGTELDRQYRLAMDEGKLVEFDFHYISRDTWWVNRFYPTPDGLAVFANEITGRKRAEEALKQARDELEERVSERTRQLSDTNTKLVNEIAERERAEVELTLAQDELSADLRTMVRLHELNTRLLGTDGLQPLLEEVLDATMELLHGDFGNVQLYDPELKAFNIVAHRGLNREFLEYFSSVAEGSAACGQALKQGRRVIIDDVNIDPRFAPHREIAALTGFRAVQSTPLFSRRGELLGMISTQFREPHHPSEHELRFLDLYAHLAAEFTERKRTEEELRKLHAELAHITRVTTLGEMTASIAHEVNQPLAAIVTNGQACLWLLSRDDLDVDEVRRAVESMIADGIRSSEVIKRMRRLLKKSRGGESSHNINNIVREVLGLLAAELTKNQIKVRTQLAAGLPYVIVDRVQIQQVVLNLILNSKEAMSMAGWQPRDLLIGSEQTGAEITVTVADSGVGIARENRDRAFEPFFTTKEAGLGLGLSVSKTIINAHGGRLWNMPGHGQTGTVFRFTLPITENDR